jgi:outer membrane protein assembly factor BamA
MKLQKLFTSLFKVKPCTIIENTTVKKLADKIRSRYGDSGRDSARATEMPPRNPPQVRMNMLLYW